MDLLAPLFSNVWAVFLLVLFFGGSIFVHELGHFLAARRRGLHVERFSIGFGPKIISWRGKDGVEYRLSWLPLGGYVSLPQLADMRAIEGESSVDLRSMPPISYSTKIIVFAAGAVFNVIFAVLLAAVIWYVGQPTSTAMVSTKIGTIAPTLTLPDNSVVPSPAFEAGLQPGDTIKAIDGKSVQDWMTLVQTLASGAGRSSDGRPQAILTIERNHSTLDVVVNPRLAGEDQFRTLGIEPADDMTIEKVFPDSPASLAGLQPGDVFIAIAGKTLTQRSELITYFQTHPDSPAALTIQREGRTLEVPIQPRAETDQAGKTVYRIGVQYRDMMIIIHPTPIEQISNHVTNTWRVLSGLVHPDSDLGPSKLSGPVGIARGFHTLAKVDIRLVLWFTILVNVNLAIFNLLPIPVLDGGHMFFATIAKLRGRALPANFIMTTQSVFMVLLFSMILYVSSYDIRRWIRDARSTPPPVEAPAK